MHPLLTAVDLTPMLTDIGERPVVLLGEASHGTHEFYTWRTALSKRLIMEKGFRFIGVEGDWPDCYQINRYVKGYAEGGADARAVLQRFDRWPTWMWANWEIVALAEWLREHNRHLPADRKVGFYGLDVYSLWDSMKNMMAYLEKEDQQAAQWVRQAVRCFEPYGEDEQRYARHSFGDGCREEVVALLKGIRMKAQHLDGDREAGFNTEQNALIAVNAERYYRSMIGFDNESWNIRDRHMMETLHRLMRFHGADAKGIVWEHNTHIGDARATDMARAGMVNIGMLARDQYGPDNVYSVGFGSYQGTVIAGDEWGAPMEEMEVPPAREGSVEAYLHEREGRDHFLLFGAGDEGEIFDSRIPHRAIGVVYDPRLERRGNYVPSVMASRYDAFIFLEETRALHPLQLAPHDEKVPETYPFGL
jgi:erythromycin esterase-like protein